MITIRTATLHRVVSALHAAKVTLEEARARYSWRVEFIIDEIDAALLDLEAEQRGGRCLT